MIKLISHDGNTIAINANNIVSILPNRFNKGESVIYCHGLAGEYEFEVKGSVDEIIKSLRLQDA